MTEDRLDIIVMGATGFSGRCTAKALMDSAKWEKISWGVAGRSHDKLRQLLQDLAEKDENSSSIPVFVADIFDEESLLKMTVKAKVVINCCGPYRFYGEPVVKACVQTKTHYLDVSGEPQFMEEMQLRYHKSSSDQGVYVISACGMSGILADLGVFHFVKLFNGTVNDIEFYINFEKTGKIGSPIHSGTWASLIHGLSHKSELRALRKKLFSKPLPNLQPKIMKRSLLHKSRLVNGWCLPFAGADRTVVRRSQYLLYTEKGCRPIQAEAYFCESLILLIILVISGAIIAIMVILGGKFSRKLLLKYPKLFSGGLVSEEGPSENEANNVIQCVTLVGNGWTYKSIDTSFAEKTNKSMKMKFTAKNPGYGFTCHAIIQAALTIIHEGNSLPGNGGVYPPGYAFSESSLIEKLQKHAGLGIEIL